MKLRNRLFLVLIVMSLLPMAAVGFWGIEQMQQALDKQAEVRMQMLADRLLERIANYLQEKKVDAGLMRNSQLVHQELPVLHTYIDQPDSPRFRAAEVKLQQLFEQRCKLFGFDHILLLDADGRLLVASDRALPDQQTGLPLPAPFDVSFEQGRSGVYLSSVYMDVREGHHHLLMSEPIYRGGQLQGVVVMTLDALAIAGQLQGLSGLGESGEALLGTRIGEKLSFITRLKFPAGLQFGPEEAQPMHRALAGQSGAGFALDHHGVEVLAAWRPVPELGWGLVAKIDADEARAPFRQVLPPALLAMLGIALAAMLAVLAIARSFNRPLSRMQQASRQIAAGDLAFRVGGDDESELGELSRSLDEMAEKLQQARAEQERLISIMDSTPDMVGMADRNGMILYINPAGRRMLGFEPDEDLSTVNVAEAHPEWVRRLVLEEGFQAAARDGVWEHETAVVDRDGREIPVLQLLVSHRDQQGQVLYFSTVMRDLSRIHALEAEAEKQRHSLQESNRDLAAQISYNDEVTRQLQQKLAEEDETRQAMLIMLEDLSESKMEIEHGKQQWESTFDAVSHPMFLHDVDGRILRTNRSYATMAGSAVETLDGQCFWHCFPKTEQRPDYCNEDVSNSLPRDAEIELDGGAVIYRVFMYPVFNAGEEYLFSVHIMEDITERKRAEQAVEASRTLLQASLEGTIQAVSHAVEARDPYTAGHQQRVARLAEAIARQLGLEEDRVQGIHYGALIHDLGKIHVPAEILSKPGRLTDNEYAIVKEHPEVGYAILKGIEFPWPVVDIIYQHHERLDGSGYPQGLKGDEICLEARIVAVADVVAAMSSHRPYRPGLDRDKTFAEVTANRGRFYDPEVVDACMFVFASGFSYE